MIGDSGGTTRQEQRRLQRNAERTEQRRTDRWRGLHRHRSVSAGLQWYYRDRDQQRSARSIGLERSGGGPPSKEALELLYRDRAIFAKAIKAAEIDDRKRNPEDPWIIDKLLERAYFGQGRNRGYSDAQIAEWAGKTEQQVTERRARALRVVRDWLMAYRDLDCGREEADGP